MCSGVDRIKEISHCKTTFLFNCSVKRKTFGKRRNFVIRTQDIILLLTDNDDDDIKNDIID